MLKLGTPFKSKILKSDNIYSILIKKFGINQVYLNRVEKEVSKLSFKYVYDYIRIDPLYAVTDNDTPFSVITKDSEIFFLNRVKREVVTLHPEEVSLLISYMAFNRVGMKEAADRLKEYIIKENLNYLLEMIG